MDVRAHNRAAWNKAVELKDQWTIPVSPLEIEAARRGDWRIILTPTLPVPRTWFPQELHGADVLCLAAGGGQQGPILAAAGATVTVSDNSPAQLAQDRFVAERDGLTIHTLEGDMRDLSALASNSFDLIVHPVSNLFVPEVRPVWQEAFRVLRPGGSLLSGFLNPITYIFDIYKADDEGVLEVKYSIPFSDLTSVSDEDRQRLIDDNAPLEFGHSLDDQIGGQIDAGFVITGFYEDRWPDFVLDRYIATFMATRAVKPVA
ncbi:MAG: class I SAM-dependent methyltransferase [Anaerolineae bacterium]|nr:class I SAM-dependent methyltransferase [Anaerolineae bacterium]MCB9131032.1 class I SAM-dependent methyltransferase [Anaerolineales bacterium]MCB0228126.1 class I SAM-dependent methyltransferase [Anaerolineae bacterium]MCB0233480.1 class I SAM-dependent methyltransferase [Anaerolineae bacterium]MCB0237063.1 class I SAM-dependent methyltransferase [Anaerolineae bacterium]